MDSNMYLANLSSPIWVRSNHFYRSTESQGKVKNGGIKLSTLGQKSKVKCLKIFERLITRVKIKLSMNISKLKRKTEDRKIK